MILLHTALKCEAQALIEHYKLEKIKNEFVIYKKNNIVLTISGIGKNNTRKSLENIFSIYKITKAINIGIVGCSNKKINKGSFFSTNEYPKNIKKMNLITVKKSQTNNTKKNCLYDMEAKYFNNTCSKNINENYIYVFKVVSDWLDDTILPKDFVKQLIKQNIKRIERYIC